MAFAVKILSKRERSRIIEVLRVFQFEPEARSKEIKCTANFQNKERATAYLKSLAALLPADVVVTSNNDSRRHKLHLVESDGGDSFIKGFAVMPVSYNGGNPVMLRYDLSNNGTVGTWNFRGTKITTQAEFDKAVSATADIYLIQALSLLQEPSERVEG